MRPPRLFLMRRLLQLWQRRLTPAGRAALLGLTAAAFLRMGALSPPLHGVLAFFAAALLAAWLTGLPFRPRVALRRRLPPWPSAGERWRYELLVENLGPRTLRDLQLAELDLPDALRCRIPPIPHLKPGARIRIAPELRCERRGAYTLAGLQVSSSFPAGLIKLGPRQALPERLLVHPRPGQVPAGALPTGGAGAPSACGRPGDPGELAGLRRWQAGDRPRDVCWTAFARTGRLVVRQASSQPRGALALILDVRAQGEALERAVSLAAGAAAALLGAGLRIELLALGPAVRRLPGSSLEAILDLLATVEPGPDLEGLQLPQEGLSGAVLVLSDPNQRSPESSLRARGLALWVLGSAGDPR